MPDIWEFRKFFLFKLKFKTKSLTFTEWPFLYLHNYFNRQWSLKRTKWSKAKRSCQVQKSWSFMVSQLTKHLSWENFIFQVPWTAFGESWNGYKPGYKRVDLKLPVYTPWKKIFLIEWTVCTTFGLVWVKFYLLKNIDCVFL